MTDRGMHLIYPPGIRPRDGSRWLLALALLTGLLLWELSPGVRPAGYSPGQTYSSGASLAWQGFSSRIQLAPEEPPPLSSAWADHPTAALGAWLTGRSSTALLSARALRSSTAGILSRIQSGWHTGWLATHAAELTTRSPRLSIVALSRAHTLRGPPTLSSEQ